MSEDEIASLSADERQHFIRCEECDEHFDKRSLDEVAFHCFGHEHRPDLPFTAGVQLQPPQR